MRNRRVHCSAPQECAEAAADCSGSPCQPLALQRELPDAGVPLSAAKWSGALLNSEDRDWTVYAHVMPAMQPEAAMRLAAVVCDGS
jgi:hypothetical protein